MLKLKQWLVVAGVSLGLVGLSTSARATEPVYLQEVQPSYATVAEDQAFILRFNQTVNPTAILAHSYCLSSAVGEQIPLKQLETDQAKILLKEKIWDFDENNAGAYLVVQCSQRLAPSSTVRLQIKNAKNQDLVPRAFTEDSSGIHFEVRAPLRAQLYCDKTKSTADCNPLRGFELRFSAPVQAKIAQQLQLIAPNGQKISAEPDESQSDYIDVLNFPATLLAQTEWQWQLPADWSELNDDSGRVLSNPGFFKKPVQTASLPPLLKFAHEGVGVLERFSFTPATEQAEPALLPVAVRGIESDLLEANPASAGEIRHLRVTSPRDMLQWYARLNRVSDYSLQKHALESAWHLQETDYTQQSPQVDPQSWSVFDFLNIGDHTQLLSLPSPPNIQEKEIELIGIPLEQSGLHILEAKSARLGASYIENDAPMYVRTAALVTNLAVHSKLSNHQLFVWVSRLDTAQPVAGAHIEVLSCNGSVLATGTTDEQGRWLQQGDFDDTYCNSTGLNGLFITASIAADHNDAYGQADTSFVLSSWDQGIEPWRFQLPYFYGADQSEMAHTVIDRPLFLAGETVHFKHYWRGEPADSVSQYLPDLVIRHVGSGDEIKQSLQWQKTPTDGWYALSHLDLATHATLGRYEVWLQGEKNQYNSAAFMVEAFKRPYLTGKLALSPSKTKKETESLALIGAKEALLDIQLNYISGGVAADQTVQISALTQPSNPSISASVYEDYRFHTLSSSVRPKTVVDKAPLVLNTQGAAQLSIPLNPINEVQELVVEASFMDPNGQIQSLAQRQTLWPAAVVVGVKHPDWEQGNRVEIKGVVIDPMGQPISQQTVEVTGQKQSYFTTRQRMVGGFYRYDSHEQLDELGTLCQTKTNDKGEWQCPIEVVNGGQIILHSSSTDRQGRTYTALSSIWLGGESQNISGENHDRIDILPEKNNAKLGETIRFQVKMPFSQATALIAVEQDRVLSTQVVSLTADHPFFDLTMQDDWGPNIYVSVLALRGRIYPTTVDDFFAGGWKTPFNWYEKYKNNANIQPSTTIDLAKPSFRYGIAQLKVATTAHALKVNLKPAQPVYRVGQTAQVHVSATKPNGEPAAQASVLFVGVDQALLELLPNTSWDLLDAMYPAIGYDVHTATMQSQVIGRRHYGRKAVPAGGGGGGAPTREVLDSLLIWRTDVVLDENGKVTIDVPLNDSLTQFELVSLVDMGGNLFGEARAQIQTHQPIQIMSGLPAEVRTGDEYTALFTVRNRESSEVTIRLEAQGFINDQLVFDLEAQSQEIKAESNQVFSQKINMPEQLGANQGQIRWQLSAHNAQTNEIVDQLVFEQAWQALVPVRAQEVIWQRLLPHQSQQFDLTLPPHALQEEGVYLGGLQLGLQPTLGGQPSVKAWFAQYPYTCFEQLASKYVALQDTMHWQKLMQELPAYIDDQNLVRYFPSPYLSGSAGLNAYLLSLSAHSPDDLSLPAPLAQKLLSGLHDYVEGRRQKPRTDATEQVAFYLAALDALARFDMIRPQMFDTIALEVDLWPTSALIDGLHVLQHPVFDKQDQSTLMNTIEHQLRQRLIKQGSVFMFTDAPLNNMPSLMVSPVTNQARLLLTVADLKAWQKDIPALMHGLLAQQHKGHWGTTTENSWALMALQRLDRTTMADGQTDFKIGDQPKTVVQWSDQQQGTITQDWTWAQNGPLSIAHLGQSPIWMQLQTKAAVPLTQPQQDGYQIERLITPIQQAVAGQWQVGDIYQVDLTIIAEHSSVWAVINDAVPAGSSILGSGLGRDTTIGVNAEMEDTNHANQPLDPSYIERLHSGYRAYIEKLPAGTSHLRYSVRLNTPGQFKLSPTQVEALYDATVAAQLPIEDLIVHAAP